MEGLDQARIKAVSEWASLRRAIHEGDERQKGKRRRLKEMEKKYPFLGNVKGMCSVKGSRPRNMGPPEGADVPSTSKAAGAAPATRKRKIEGDKKGEIRKRPKEVGVRIGSPKAAERSKRSETEDDEELARKVARLDEDRLRRLLDGASAEREKERSSGPSSICESSN